MANFTIGDLVVDGAKDFGIIYKNIKVVGRDAYSYWIYWTDGEQTLTSEAMTNIYRESYLKLYETKGS